MTIFCLQTTAYCIQLHTVNSICMYQGNTMTTQSRKNTGGLKDRNKSAEESTGVIKRSLRGGTKTVSLSTRISQEDAEFLSALTIQGANTPSEKLRVIIAETRKRHDGMQDYRSSLMMYQDLLNRVVSVTRELELEHQIHSELLTRLTEWLPDMMAFLTATGAELQHTGSVENLKYLEEGITERSFRLIQSVLQMGITDTCPCYQTDAVSKRMAAVINLVNVIQK